MISPDVLSAFLFTVLWVIWVVVGIASVVMFFRGMSALVKIPERLDRIERALTRQQITIDEHAS